MEIFRWVYWLAPAHNSHRARHNWLAQLVDDFSSWLACDTGSRMSSSPLTVPLSSDTFESLWVISSSPTGAVGAQTKIDWSLTISESHLSFFQLVLLAFCLDHKSSSHRHCSTFSRLFNFMFHAWSAFFYSQRFAFMVATYTIRADPSTCVAP